MADTGRVVIPGHDEIPEATRMRALHIANAELAEALRDLCFAANMPAGEGRVGKIAAATFTAEKAIERIRNNVIA
jgi:hypothetical protein